MIIKTVEELYNIIEHNNIYIYGIGYVATRFFSALKKIGYLQHIKGFIVTDAVCEDFEGLEVRSIDNISFENEMICIAVHESSKNEIISVLKQKGLNNYIWIYPYLWQMMCGVPVLSHVKIPLKKIWLANKDYYFLAFRYLAIDQFYGIRKDGFDIYLNCLSLFQSRSSAKKRLNNFINLIQSYEKNGYDETHFSSILENFMVIDGTHRIALNSYHNYKDIMCNVFSGDIDYFSIHARNTLIPEDSLSLLDSHSIELLKETNYRISKQYNGK